MSNPKMREFFTRMEDLGLMLTYDDVRLRSRYSEVLPSDVDPLGRFSRRIKLNVPIASSPMDTVTTASMAIALAESGGIGVIHRGMDPEAQAKEVGRVKHRLHGRIETPISVRVGTTVHQVLAMMEKNGYRFHTYPVLDEAGKVVGLLTKNDFDFCEDVSSRVERIMTPLSSLLTLSAGVTPGEAHEFMLKHKKKVLPLISSDGTLSGMYLLSDTKRVLARRGGHNLDARGQLVVAAAVGVGTGAQLRAEILSERGCDVFQIDTAHGDSRNVIETIRELKKKYPDIDVVAGNVSSGASARRLADAGTDGILVGQGPGSICTTRVIAGIGVPQVSAIYECARAIEGRDIPVCADGGINNSGDIVIALAVGAESVMLGRLLAGTEEAPGITRFYNGMQVKDYRGMGSLGAMRENASSRERYGQGGVNLSKAVPEGIEGVVPYKGRAEEVLHQYVGGLRSGMAYNGARNLDDLREGADLFRISSSGLAESHSHDVRIVADAPNYNSK